MTVSTCNTGGNRSKYGAADRDFRILDQPYFGLGDEQHLDSIRDKVKGLVRDV